MLTHNPKRPSPRGFTLIELLVVMGIIAVLASMLLPAMFAVSAEAKVSYTRGLISRIRLALDAYHKDFAYYPPDYINQGRAILDFQSELGPHEEGCTKRTITTPAYPAEALYYFLCHRALTDEHPLLTVKSGREAADSNANQLPEITDYWGRPILYNRPAFPACSDSFFNYAGNPKHNADSYDIYSVGADGQTGSNDVPEFSGNTFAQFFSKAMNEASDGEGDDDIQNWEK